MRITPPQAQLLRAGSGKGLLLTPRPVVSLAARGFVTLTKTGLEWRYAITEAGRTALQDFDDYWGASGRDLSTRTRRKRANTRLMFVGPVRPKKDPYGRTKADRLAAEMRDARAAGATYSHIGRAFGMTAANAYQRIAVYETKHNLPSALAKNEHGSIDPVRDARLKARHDEVSRVARDKATKWQAFLQKAMERGAKLHARHAGGETMRQIAKEEGISLQRVQQIIAKHRERLAAAEETRE